LFLPGFIGIANNADFGKVAGHLSLAAPDGGESNFLYFQPNYVRSPANYWASPFYSSEIALAWIAAHFTTGPHFDIRLLGAVHAALFLAALAALLQVRVAVAAFASFVFTDVCYAAYFNSFYMDAAALCGLLLLVATACWIAVTREISTIQFALYAL